MRSQPRRPAPRLRSPCRNAATCCVDLDTRARQPGGRCAGAVPRSRRGHRPPRPGVLRVGAGHVSLLLVTTIPTPCPYGSGSNSPRACGSDAARRVGTRHECDRESGRGWFGMACDPAVREQCASLNRRCRSRPAALAADHVKWRPGKAYQGAGPCPRSVSGQEPAPLIGPPSRVIWVSTCETPTSQPRSRQDPQPRWTCHGNPHMLACLANAPLQHYSDHRRRPGRPRARTRHLVKMEEAQWWP